MRFKLVQNRFANYSALVWTVIKDIKKPQSLTDWGFLNLAETERFELSKGYEPLPVFKTGAFNRSAIPPAYGGEYYQFRLAGQVFAAFPIDVADQQDIEHLRLEPTDGILGLLKDCHNDQPQGALT